MLRTSAMSTGAALYLAVVQSSGYGKSRLLRQLANVRHVLYVCLRQPNSNGYPEMTDDAMNPVSDVASDGLTHDNVVEKLDANLERLRARTVRVFNTYWDQFNRDLASAQASSSRPRSSRRHRLERRVPSLANP